MEDDGYMYLLACTAVVDEGGVDVDEDEVVVVVGVVGSFVADDVEEVVVAS